MIGPSGHTTVTVRRDDGAVSDHAALIGRDSGMMVARAPIQTPSWMVMPWPHANGGSSPGARGVPACFRHPAGWWCASGGGRAHRPIAESEGLVPRFPPVPPQPVRLLLVGYLVVLALLTIVPVLGPDVTEIVVLLTRTLGVGGSHRTVSVVDAVTNVLLFVPAGLLFQAAVPRFRPVHVWLLCVAGSAVIELAQALVVPGRDPSAVDVATNALGAALGVLLAQPLLRRSIRDGG